MIAEKKKRPHIINNRPYSEKIKDNVLQYYILCNTIGKIYIMSVFIQGPRLTLGKASGLGNLTNYSSY